MYKLKNLNVLQLGRKIPRLHIPQLSMFQLRRQDDSLIIGEDMAPSRPNTSQLQPVREVLIAN